MFHKFKECDLYKYYDISDDIGDVFRSDGSVFGFKYRIRIDSKVREDYRNGCNVEGYVSLFFEEDDVSFEELYNALYVKLNQVISKMSDDVISFKNNKKSHSIVLIAYKDHGRDNKNVYSKTFSISAPFMSIKDIKEIIERFFTRKKYEYDIECERFWRDEDEKNG